MTISNQVNNNLGQEIPMEALGAHGQSSDNKVLAVARDVVNRIPQNVEDLRQIVNIERPVNVRNDARDEARHDRVYDRIDRRVAIRGEENEDEVNVEVSPRAEGQELLQEEALQEEALPGNDVLQSFDRIFKGSMCTLISALVGYLVYKTQFEN